MSLKEFLGIDIVGRFTEIEIFLIPDNKKLMNKKERMEIIKFYEKKGIRRIVA